MPKIASIQSDTSAWALEDEPTLEQVAAPHWYVLWTRSNYEQVVCDQLHAKGFEAFLPKIGHWSKRGNLRRLSRIPIFPGYLFLHHMMDKFSYIEVCKSRGLVRILGERWNRLAAVPDSEVEAIRRVVRAGLPTSSHAYLQEGQRVRVTRGPLADVEGILVRSDPCKGLLILSVELLRRSVAVQIDCNSVVPTTIHASPAQEEVAGENSLQA